MNEIKLRGYIRDISRSHQIDDIEYDKANLIVNRDGLNDDVLNLRFKRFSNTYKNGDEIELVGNVRSYSTHLSNGKNKVEIYVFTYFDKPENFESTNNTLILDGRICKIDDIRILKNGKRNIHFTIANNLDVGENGKKLNSYLPCVAWGKCAKEISKLSVNDKIKIYGKLQSREYKKFISDDEFEIRVAHEVYVDSFELDND